MDTAVVIALIALAGSIFSAVLTVWGGPTLQARRDARKTLETYREPLLGAAYELQARLHNVLRNDFVANYIIAGKAGKPDAALTSTLYVFAQFFGWLEIIRQEIQFLRFGRDAETREVARVLRDIVETFLSEDYGPQFMIWRVEQRGLGERMIAETEGRPTCLGYASFLDRRPTMEEWLAPLERDLRALGDEGRARLTHLQHLLLQLVRKLDPEETRYPFALEEA